MKRKMKNLIGNYFRLRLQDKLAIATLGIGIVQLIIEVVK